MKKILVVLLTAILLAGCPSASAQLSAVTPNMIPVGAPNTLLKLTGKNFVGGGTVYWNSTHGLATTFVNQGEIDATVPASYLTAAGSAKVAIAFPSPASSNQVVTQSLTITIGNVVPTLATMSPMHVIANTSGLTLTLTGTNFNSTSVVNWGSTALTTTLVSATQVTAAVPSNLYASAGSASVTVVNPGTGGGTSSALVETIVAALAITTTTLPGGSPSAAYTATLTATGGVLPYTWAITSGSLPAGLTLNAATGVISGTPTAPGTSSFTVSCTDSTGTLALKKMGK
jgi:hypothetical protein